MSNEEDDEEELRRRLFLLRALFKINDDREELLAKNCVNKNARKVNRMKYTRITRIAQLDSWDCGVACLLMISQWLQDDMEHNFEETGNKLASERKRILSAVGTESIWTSDLMWQLHSWKTKRKPWWSSLAWFGGGVNGSSFEEAIKSRFDFVLASKLIMDADESYRNFQYYQNSFEEDQSRVTSTFRKLYEQNVPMLQTINQLYKDRDKSQKGLSLSTVIEIVEQEECVAIVLLDNNVLSPESNELTSTLQDGNKQNESNCLPYAGHYVILCGTSNDPMHVEIANDGEETSGDCVKGQGRDFCFVVCNPDPSSTRADSNYVYVMPQRLEAAWRTEGTDEDIIFLRKLPRGKGKANISAFPQHKA